MKVTWGYDPFISREQLGGKLDSEIATLKKQVESFVTESIEQVELVLKHAASREQLQEGLRSKAGTRDLAREIERLKSLVTTKHEIGCVHSCQRNVHEHAMYVSSAPYTIWHEAFPCFETFRMFTCVQRRRAFQ